MISKKFLLPLFLIVAAIQIYIPAKMILNQERVLETGNLFKFRTAPVDPNDPFRGKYITLSFDQNVVPVKTDSIWQYGDIGFVTIAKDSAGFAYPKAISKTAPADQADYLQVTVSGAYGNEVYLDYPFTRFYMDEYKAPEAELTYQEAQRDTTSITYALVAIKTGDAVLKDVLIDEVPIRELVINNRKED